MERFFKPISSKAVEERPGELSVQAPDTPYQIANTSADRCELPL